MSTRETALQIFNRLSERQLEGFIALFNGYDADNDFIDEEQNERNNAFDDLMKMRKHIPDFNEKAELLSYLDERYGV